MKMLVRVSIAVAALLVGSTLTWAQVTSAVLQGTVTDNLGGVLPGVVVKVTNADTGLVREAASDTTGFFRASALPPGTYAIHVRLDAFTPYSRTGLTLTVGQTAMVDVQLALASLNEAVTVEARTPLVDTSSNALGTTITTAQLDDLPLAGRDFAALARLAPGVTSVGSNGITAGGQLTRNNSVVVDGTSNDEQGVAGTRGSFSLESVREYVVYTNQFAAEHGLAAGALVNVVTRSGTNTIDGRVFAFHRDDSLDARNPFSKAQGSGNAPFTEQRAGGFLGGPFIKNIWHHPGAPAVLVGIAIQNEVLDRCQVSVTHGREDPRSILGHDIAADLERLFFRQRQPPNDIWIRARLTPLRQEIERIREKVRFPARSAGRMGDAPLESREERFDERLPVTIRGGECLHRLNRGISGQRRQNLRCRQRRCRHPPGLVCESIDARPERTPRTAPAHGIVDAFLMRTPHDAVGRDRVLHAVLAEKVSNTGRSGRIVAHIDRLRRPRAHRGRFALAGPLEHRDDEFRRERVVWPIRRNGCQGVLSGAPTVPS